MRRLFWLCAGLALLPGCGTIGSWASGCGGLWSGVRHDGDLLGTFGAEMLAAREVHFGADGWFANSWDTVLVVLDLPLSAVADTLSAPVSLVRGQREPEPVGLGCRWAASPAEWGSVASRDPDGASD